MKSTERTHDEGNFEQEIRASLSSLRVDEDDFAKMVLDRIREDGSGTGTTLDLGCDGANGDEGGDSSPSNFMRRAAAVLPPFLFPKGIAKVGVGAGSAGLSKAGLKFLPGLAMLPMALVLMIFATAFMGLRSLTAGNRSQTHDHEMAMEEVKLWWGRNKLATVAVVALLAYLVFEAPTDAVVLLLLVSTLTMIAIVGVLSSKGLASRPELASRFSSMVLMVMIYSLQFMSSRGEVNGPLHSGYAIPVLAAGTAILFGFGKLKHDGSVVEASVRRTVIGTLVLGAGLFGFSLLGQQRVYVADVVAWIEESDDSKLSSPTRWYEIQATVSHLRSAGGIDLDLSAWTEDVHRQLDRALDGKEFNSLYALPIQRLELERDQDREFWLSDYQRKVMLDPETRHFSSRHDEITLLALDRMTELSEEEKSMIADRILNSLPSIDTHDALGDLVGVHHVLQRIDRKAQPGQLEGVAHQALLATWTPNTAGDQAAFPGSASQQERDESGELNEPRLTFVWLSSTSHAINAMDHFGVPEGIDLLALEKYLLVQSREFVFTELTPYSALAVSSLAHLRSLEEYQTQKRERSSPTLISWATEYRMLLASLLLVTFAIGATLRAPSLKA